MFAPKSIYPLITFRILFGLLMCFGTARFMYNGWIEKLFVTPRHFFKFQGFEWIESLNVSQLYTLHWIIIISAFFIAIGFLYRASIITFFLSFTYIELLDASNYLNHYYLVILLALLMIFLPANASFSLDAKLFPHIKKEQISAWCIHVIIAQLCIVYFYAGLAKMQPDWLLRAMPLSIWLPEHQDIPILGYFFQFPLVAKFSSWFGAFYDLTIWAFLLYPKSRPFAYVIVVAFHALTGLLFNIGLFPLIMISSTLIFFSGQWHRKLYTIFSSDVATVDSVITNDEGFSTPRFYTIFSSEVFSRLTKITITSFLSIYFLFQFLFPFRSHLYTGNVLWNEQGYRFSWRVMAVEKSGTAIFYLEDKDTGRKVEINNNKYLTNFQEKQMCIQPDFILQYVKIIAKDYKEKHDIQNPKITANVFVALNRRSSSRLIDPNINLLELNNSFQNKEWILPLKN
ncbi:MAG: hypothetical protein ACI94Y_002045 [Maribacter sp.]|jgi:hypothetical protein